VDLTCDDLLTTTRSVRRRLDLTRPVPRALVEECLHVAFQAPNGSNLQRWRWIVVDDPGTRAAMADINRRALADQMASSAARARQRDSATPAASAASAGKAPTPDRAAFDRMSASVLHLIEHLHEVPVLVVPCTFGRLDGRTIFEQATMWGSILPAAWSFMLALRTRGLGCAWTTLHLWREHEMAELLGIPHEKVTQAGLFPVGYATGGGFRRGDRVASADSITWNHW
jgi:nitroreductase